MSNVAELSHAFIGAHPADAARVLEHLPPEASAELFAQTPVRVVAPTLRSMMPFIAAQTITQLPADTAAHLLNECGAGASAAIIRYVPESRRAALIEALPTPTAVSVRLLLGFPASAVGAWIDTALPALTADTSAETALARLRSSAEDEINVIHVVDTAQRLLGFVDLGTLLRAGGNVSIAHLMKKVEHVLPVHATLASVKGHAGWNEQLVLPAIERDGRLVGVLRRSELLQALAHTQRGSGARTHRHVTVVEALGGGYWAAVDGLMQAIVDLLPAPNALRRVPPR